MSVITIRDNCRAMWGSCSSNDVALHIENVGNDEKANHVPNSVDVPWSYCFQFESSVAALLNGSIDKCDPAQFKFTQVAREMEAGKRNPHRGKAHY